LLGADETAERILDSNTGRRRLADLDGYSVIREPAILEAVGVKVEALRSEVDAQVPQTERDLDRGDRKATANRSERF
jgi:hypothetical protein